MKLAASTYFRPRVFAFLRAFALSERTPFSIAFAICILTVADASAQQPVTAEPLDPPSFYQPLSSSTPAGPRSLPLRLVAGEEAAPHAETRPPLALAPRSQPRDRPLTKAAAPDPTSAIGTVVGSLGVVLGLFVVLVWCSRRFAPAGTAALPKEAWESLGRAPLAGRQQVQLVRVGNRLLVLALTPTTAATLAEITDAAEVEQLVALCRRGRPGSSSAAFRHVLDQLATEPAPGGFVGAASSSRRGGR